jgi:HAD superfamily hydrolase (TIGR01509 family)
MSKKYKCVIFDCDGVLVDSEGISEQVLSEMSLTVGVNLSDYLADKKYVGKSLAYIFKHIEKEGNVKLPNNFEQQFRVKTFQAFRKNLQPIPGIKDVLNKIHVPFCVASNGPVEKIRLNLEVTGLIDKFEGKIFSAYQLQKWKPDPALFLHAAQQMGFEAKECLVIEDSVVGVEAAQAGGFNVLGYVGGYHKHPLGDVDISIIHNMKELSHIVNA